MNLFLHFLVTISSHPPPSYSSCPPPHLSHHMQINSNSTLTPSSILYSIHYHICFGVRRGILIIHLLVDVSQYPSVDDAHSEFSGGVYVSVEGNDGIVGFNDDLCMFL